ncbi:prepilin peptidase [Ostreibacterium oceani]|uniref:Prepilin peptidase A24 N-terminal domain-containing protein n=1 Tax=Ostreibacterium oceani TaxID=2654998 RepID=A0A6N7EUN2_9GAMM|nr:prepilin peptidase [Ostreibacterium oceani]MPV86162.1 hypothetical protein [Ostreibacterium oceani]
MIEKINKKIFYQENIAVGSLTNSRKKDMVIYLTLLYSVLVIPYALFSLKRYFELTINTHLIMFLSVTPLVIALIYSPIRNYTILRDIHCPNCKNSIAKLRTKKVVSHCIQKNQCPHCETDIFVNDILDERKKLNGADFPPPIKSFVDDVIAVLILLSVPTLLWYLGNKIDYDGYYFNDIKILIVFSSMLAWFYFSSQKLLSKHICPHCGGSLFSMFIRQTQQTKNCALCGIRIIK